MILPAASILSMSTRLASPNIDAFGERITGDFFALADVFAQSDWFGVIPSQWDVTIEVRTTNDNPADRRPGARGRR